MNVAWDDVRHVTKVDPAKPIPDLDVLGSTDLVMVGGSDGVTAENTLETVESIKSRWPSMTVLQEPYRAEQVSKSVLEAIDFCAIPAVFNGDRDHFVGKHLAYYAELCKRPETVVGAGIPVVGEFVTSRGRDAVVAVADRFIGEGYVIQNVDSKAAQRTGVTGAATRDEVAGAALATESFYGFPIFYVEYSGTYGGPADVEAAAQYLEETTLLYGGGISSSEQANEILDAGADAIVVGDCFHENPDAFLETLP